MMNATPSMSRRPSSTRSSPVRRYTGRISVRSSVSPSGAGDDEAREDRRNDRAAGVDPQGHHDGAEHGELALGQVEHAPEAVDQVRPTPSSPN